MLTNNSIRRRHFQDLGEQNVAQPEEELVADNNMILNYVMINKGIAIAEIRTHAKKLKNNKSSQIDNILNEFIKCSPIRFLLTLLILFNIVMNSVVISASWTIVTLKPIYKNEDNINTVSNYMGITLLICVGKLFTSLSNSRIYDFLSVNELLGEDQAGFRKLYSTMDHIFA